MDVNLSRSGAHGPVGELRQEIPLEILGVLDAIAVARDMKRCELVTEVLRRWARQQVHEAESVRRVLRGQSGASETFGVKVE